MSERNNKSLDLNPVFLKWVLDPQRQRLPEDAARLHPEFPYDPELINLRLGSVGIPLSSPNNIATVAGQIMERQVELALGKGVGGTLRSILMDPQKSNFPFASKVAYYHDSPGPIWVHFREMGTEWFDGLMPLSQANVMIRNEYERRRLFPELPKQFEVVGARVLPEFVSRYTAQLQREQRQALVASPDTEPLPDFQELRQRHLGVVELKSDLQPQLRKVREAYLGKTTWGSIVALETLLRAADFAIGHIPVAAAFWDLGQAVFNTDLPFPFAERYLRNKLKQKDLPLPEGIFAKAPKGRVIELIDFSLELLQIFFPPAWLANPLIEGGIQTWNLATEMAHTREYIPSFLEIARETGRTPDALDRIGSLRGLPRALIERLRRNKNNPTADV